MLPPGQQLEEFRWLLRRRGPLGLAKELIDLGVARLPFVNRAQWLRADIAAVPASSTSDDFTVATAGDLERLSELVTPQTLREMTLYLSHPKAFDCVVSPRFGPALNHLCVSYESVTQRGMTVRVPADSIYLFSGYTHPTARRRGLSRASIIYACRQLAHERSTAWALVDTENEAQRSVLLKLGFRIMSTIDLRVPLVSGRTRPVDIPR